MKEQKKYFYLLPIGLVLLISVLALTFFLRPTTITSEKEIATNTLGLAAANRAQEITTDWLNYDVPTGSGEYETIANHKESLPCEHPIGIECQTIKGVDWTKTNDIELTCDLEQGFICYNEQQPDYGCEDYQVRFIC